MNGKKSQNKTMNILIFGGAGFVGRHYAKYFLERGNLVEIIDNIAPLSGGIHPKKWKLFNPFKFKKKFKFSNNDCRNFFKNNLNKKYDLVINLAAIVGGREVIENNPLAVAEDLEIDTAFWRWAVKNKIKIGHIITYSSSAAYPVHLQRRKNYRLLKETDIDFSKNFPFPSIIKRAINHKSKKIFIVWGSGYQMRDFIHIEDVVRGSLLIAKKIKNGKAVNLSSGKFLDFITLSKKILAILGKKNIKVKGNSTKPEGVFARGGSRSMQKKFGFSPNISIEQGITSAIEYFDKNKIK